ncbi:hypothetical protein GGX14DRAFT_568429 [Mycena pura]|uniref:F-box domain-containing protein n=1 Tax=Mycena pura TaxID=153505 RepID=A0AAD6Y7P1_9AGAR|nr:hypothetical protein GGX14DRAFT_568429 [Mycena pura]
MGQTWQVVNLDKRECYELGKVREFFTGGVDDTDLANHSGRVGGNSLLPLTLQKQPRAAALVNFPVETIQEIHSHIKDFRDVVCFSMTCQVLWEIGRSEIYRRITALVNAPYSWAGDRIICIGDSLRNEDIPEGLLSAEEKKDLLINDYNHERRSLYDYPFNETTELGPLSLTTLLSKQWSHWWACPDMRVFHRLCEDSPKLLPLRAPRVLRNLSRQQYVRESTTLAKYRRGTMDEIDDVGFGGVLLFRICLSSSISVESYTTDIAVRGVWVGDRFDVVSADWLETASGWTDVSDEALKEVEAL